MEQMIRIGNGVEHDDSSRVKEKAAARVEGGVDALKY